MKLDQFSILPGMEDDVVSNNLGGDMISAFPSLRSLFFSRAIRLTSSVNQPRRIKVQLAQIAAGVPTLVAIQLGWHSSIATDALYIALKAAFPTFEAQLVRSNFFSIPANRLDPRMYRNVANVGVAPVHCYFFGVDITKLGEPTLSYYSEDGGVINTDAATIFKAASQFTIPPTSIYQPWYYIDPIRIPLLMVYTYNEVPAGQTVAAFPNAITDLVQEIGPSPSVDFKFL